MGCQPSTTRNVANKDDTAKVTIIISPTLLDNTQQQLQSHRSNDSSSLTALHTCHQQEATSRPPPRGSSTTSLQQQQQPSSQSRASSPATSHEIFVNASLVVQRGDSTCESATLKQEHLNHVAHLMNLSRQLSWDDQTIDAFGDD